MTSLNISIQDVAMFVHVSIYGQSTIGSRYIAVKHNAMLHTAHKLPILSVGYSPELTKDTYISPLRISRVIWRKATARYRGRTVNK